MRPGRWSAARLRHDLAGDMVTIAYTLKGRRHMAHAVPLVALLQAVQPRLNPNIKNHEVQFVALVRGRDGYTADFSLAELLPSFGHRHVWIALDEDGKSLTDDAGPVQILVPEDIKPARWVHAVSTIALVDMAQYDQSDKG